MLQNLGRTRSAIGPLHALIAPDSHEKTPMPEWPGCVCVIVISPQMGARFTQFFVDMPAGCASRPLPGDVMRFVLVLSGAVTLVVDGGQRRLAAEGYALLPAGREHSIRADSEARLIVLERSYTPLGGTTPPEPVVGDIRDIGDTRHAGDPRLRVQKLLPETLAFDCEFNVMTFAPGAALGYVETHFMEHGLLMLDGGGIYRLNTSWYPVAAGDVIWMGPYCPQWFGAIDQADSRYLLYKNWNRRP